MNGMTSVRRSSLPMMCRAIDRIIKLPSTIGLKSSLSDKFWVTIKFDKTNTIIANLTTNMAQKGIQDSDKIRFLSAVTPL